MEKEFAIFNTKGDVCARVMATDHQAAAKKAHSALGVKPEHFSRAEEQHKPHVEVKAEAKKQKNTSDKGWDGKHDNNLQANVEWRKSQ